MDRSCNRAHRMSLLPRTYYTAGAAVGIAVGLQRSAISCTSLPYYAAGAFVGLAQGIHQQANVLLGREETHPCDPITTDAGAQQMSARAVPSGTALTEKPAPLVAPSRPPAHPASTQQQAGPAGNHRPGVYVAMNTPEYMPGGPTIDDATVEQLVQRYSRSLPSSRRQSAGSIYSFDSSYMSHINTAGGLLPSCHSHHVGTTLSASNHREAA